jgi:hypothetical protein
MDSGMTLWMRIAMMNDIAHGVNCPEDEAHVMRELLQLS